MAISLNEKTFCVMDYYQEKTVETAVYPHAGVGDVDALSYVGLGLAGEAGEIANKIKKILRDDNGTITEERRAELLDELGDVLWYAARLAHELDSTLGRAAINNLAKLERRKQRGTLKGSGDKR